MLCIVQNNFNLLGEKAFEIFVKVSTTRGQRVEFNSMVTLKINVFVEAFPFSFKYLPQEIHQINPP